LKIDNSQAMLGLWYLVLYRLVQEKRRGTRCESWAVPQR